MAKLSSTQSVRSYSFCRLFETRRKSYSSVMAKFVVPFVLLLVAVVISVQGQGHGGGGHGGHNDGHGGHGGFQGGHGHGGQGHGAQYHGGQGGHGVAHDQHGGQHGGGHGGFGHGKSGGHGGQGHQELEGRYDVHAACKLVSFSKVNPRRLAGEGLIVANDANLLVCTSAVANVLERIIITSVYCVGIHRCQSHFLRRMRPASASPTTASRPLASDHPKNAERSMNEIETGTRVIEPVSERLRLQHFFVPGQGKIVPQRGPPVGHSHSGNVQQPKIGAPPPVVHVGAKTQGHNSASYTSGTIQIVPKRVPQGPNNHGSGQFVKNYPPPAAATHFRPQSHTSSFGGAHAGVARVGSSNQHAAKHTQTGPAIGHGPGGYEHRRTHQHSQPQHG
uniref:Uncharacterized protein n=1 Tax=Anopheles albimanus TaxID=7167 RepID=A0A182FEE4_ANOAL